MFEKLFPHRATAVRYHQWPSAAERQLYLSKLIGPVSGQGPCLCCGFDICRLDPDLIERKMSR